MDDVQLSVSTGSLPKDVFSYCRRLVRGNAPIACRDKQLRVSVIMPRNKNTYVYFLGRSQAITSLGKDSVQYKLRLT
jgi:hypothetical protein